MFFFKDKIKTLSKDEAIEADMLKVFFTYPCERLSELDFNTIIDKLYDSQVFTVTMLLHHGTNENIALGPNVRAGLINRYIKYLSKINKEQLLEMKGGVKEGRSSVKNFYNSLKEKAIQDIDFRKSFSFSDYLAVLWDVKFRFNVPTINF